MVIQTPTGPIRLISVKGWEPTASLLSAKRILLVEDNEFVRGYVAHVLRDAGYVVDEARTGAEALCAASGATPDLVVAGLSLPDTTGPKLVAALRARDLPGVLVLFVSGHQREAAEDSWLLPAGATFLAKPFTPDALRSAVGELLASVGKAVVVA